MTGNKSYVSVDVLPHWKNFVKNTGKQGRLLKAMILKAHMWFRQNRKASQLFFKVNINSVFAAFLEFLRSLKFLQKVLITTAKPNALFQNT